MQPIAQTADLGGLGVDTRTRNEGSAPLLPANHALSGQFGQSAAHRDQTDSGQGRYLRFRGKLIALAQLLFVDVLQNEGDGFFVK